MNPLFTNFQQDFPELYFQAKFVVDYFEKQQLHQNSTPKKNVSNRYFGMRKSTSPEKDER